MGRLINIALIGIMGLFMILCVILFIYTANPRKTNIDLFKFSQENIEKIKEDNFLLPIINYEKIIVNLPSSPRRLKFITFNLSLSPINPDAAMILQNKDYLINDVAIYEASQMEGDELNTYLGKSILESRIRKHINDSFNMPVVKRIYFDHFVIQ